MIKAASVLVAGIAFLAPAAPAIACPDADARPPQLTADEARDSVVCLMNKRRRSNGLQKLTVNVKLQRAAQRHSNSMDAGNYFDHDSPNGSDPISRIQDTGYLSGARSWGVGETIRWGSGSLSTPRVAVQEWMNSASHREIMLSGSYRQVGVGVALGAPINGYGRDAAIYTADFGYRR